MQVEGDSLVLIKGASCVWNSQLEKKNCLHLRGHDEKIVEYYLIKGQPICTRAQTCRVWNMAEFPVNQNDEGAISTLVTHFSSRNSIYQEPSYGFQALVFRSFCALSNHNQESNHLSSLGIMVTFHFVPVAQNLLQNAACDYLKTIFCFRKRCAAESIKHLLLKEIRC